MARKSFKSGIDEILGISENKNTEKFADKEKTDESRTSIVVKSQYLNKLKSIAYWERKTLKNITDEAFDFYIQSYEEKNGEVNKSP
jgi:hypothetical protein